MLRRKLKREESANGSGVGGGASGRGGGVNGSTTGSPSSDHASAPLPNPHDQALNRSLSPQSTTSSFVPASTLGSTDSGNRASSTPMHDTLLAHHPSSRTNVPLRPIPASNSIDVMSQSPSSHSQDSTPFYQQSVGANSSNNNVISSASASMGRSQSAFNFILSKAKASFSSSAQQQSAQQQQQQQPYPSSMNASTSLSSIHTLGSGGQLEESGTSRPRDVYPQGFQSIHRSSTSDFSSPRFPSSVNTRPSFGDEPTPMSSPTKRSLFGSHRERKVSVNSTGRGGAGVATGANSRTEEKAGWSGAGAGSRPPFSQSPLGRGHRQEVHGLSYGHFSKSQSDLQMRATSDFPSPVKKAIDLPPLPTAPASLLAKSNPTSDTSKLQSPTSNLGFSKSVDDLNREQPGDLRGNGSSQDNAPQFGSGTWGEVGMPEAGNWGRPSDTGTMSNNRWNDRASPSASTSQGGGQIPFSSAPSYQASPTMQNTAWPLHSVASSSSTSPNLLGASISSSSKHQRKASKLSSSPRDQGIVTPALPPAAMQASQGSGRPLPFGVEFEGFLNRNVNVSLPLAQLADTGSSKGKEKDIGKGWKPYKVLVREGKLFFYKPTGTIGDEVKTLFPAGLVSSGGQQGGNLAQYTKDVGIKLEDLQKNRLGTQDLLVATSRSGSDQAIPTRPSSRRPNATNAPNDRLSAIADDREDDELEGRENGQNWEKKGKHKDLVLADVQMEPSLWWQRVEGGSLEAVAHEYVFATQLDPSLDSLQSREEEAERLLYAVIVAIVRSHQSLLRFVEEAGRWTAAAMGLEKEDDWFRGDETQWLAFQESLRARIRLVVKSDVVNMVSGREDMLQAIEVLIQAAWSKDRAQAEAELASVLTCHPTTTSRDHLAVDRSSDLVKRASALRPSALLSLEPSLLARQIHIFTALQYDSLHLPDSSLLRLLNGDNSESIRLISFDATRPHFLTRLVLDHVLQSSAPLEGVALHGPKLRASLLRHWIAVASYLLKLDNVSAWCAICAALCSRSLARLSSSWRFVASNDRILVGTIWAPILVQLGWSETQQSTVQAFLESASVIKSSVTQTVRTEGLSSMLPYLGNGIVQAACSRVTAFSLRSAAPSALDILALTKKWRSSRSISPFQAVGGDAELQMALESLSVLNRHASFDAGQMLHSSLQLESPKLGKVDLKWRPALTQSMAACALSPIVFSEPLPHLSLVDAESLETQMTPSAGQSEHRSNGGDGAKSAMVPTRLSSLDMEATITGRTPVSRPALNISPISRSRAFPPRQLREVPFASIIEWSPGTWTLGENVIKVGADLILLVAPDQAPSLPSSPMTSKRFSQEMNRASRPLSQVSKRSSLPASNRSSVIDSPVVPLLVTIKTATLERLVDVLAMGVQHIILNPTDDSVDRDVTPSRRSRLTMDLPAYRKTFLSTYRSFCSPIVLFDFLRKRFLAAINASRQLGLPAQHRPSNPFPTWSRMESVSGSHGIPVDWDMVARIRSGILSVFTIWIAQHPHDFAEDDELYNGFHTLVDGIKSEGSGEAGDVEWEKTVAGMEDVLRQLQLGVMTCCVQMGEKRTMKRSSKRVSKQNARLSALHSLSSTSSDKEAGARLDFDEASPHGLIEYLESVAKVFFDKIDEKDLHMASELFQGRSSDPTSWFIAKNSSSSLASQHPEEMPQVNNMYKLMELIRWPRDGPTLLHRLAPSIRDACAAQNLLRGWIAIHIIESRIGVARREARIEKLLDAIWICRARMANVRMEEASLVPMQATNVFREPTIASFVECLIVGSLTSSESRLFTRAWQGVAARRNGSCDNLTSLYPSSTLAESYRESTMQTCTPDIGWVLHTMAEALTRASMDSQGDSTLVDFEKFRTTWSIIESSTLFSSMSKLKANAVVDANLVELAEARLSAMQNALRSVNWERRAFKEDAAGEATMASPLNVHPHSLMRANRPMIEITQRQQEKHRRDRRAVEMLEYAQHAKRSQQAAAAAAATAPTPTTTPSSLSTSQQPQNRSYSTPPQATLTPSLAVSVSEKKTRRMTALFRGAVRPMGLIGSSNEKVHHNADQPGHSVDQLLSLTPTQKASLVVNCGSSLVNVWYNGQRSFVFHLSLVEGGHILLQASSQKEMTEWCSVIEKASKEFALPASALAPHDGPRGKGGKKGSPAVPLYGSDIKVLVEYEKRPVPLGLLRMLEEVEARGLREQGIYRISGAKNAIESLKQSFGKHPADAIDLNQGEFSDIHTISGAIKQWFRDLPEPAVPFAFYHRIIEAEQIEGEEDRLYAIRDIVWDFPKPHFDLLNRISQHLALVCDEGKHNLMAPHNVALVFGTSLLNPPPGPSSVAESFGNIGKAAHIVKIIVTMHDWLFEPEPEAETEAELVGGPAEPGSVDEQGWEGESRPSERGLDGVGGEEGGDEGEEREVGEETILAPSSSQLASPQLGEQPQPSPIFTLDRPRDVLPLEASSDSFTMPLTRAGGQQQEVEGSSLGLGAPRLEGGAPSRERMMIESIYLDATDAIAALQDPFEEEEEGTEEEEEEEGEGGHEGEGGKEERP